MNKIAAKVAKQLQKQKGASVVSLGAYKQAREAAAEAMADIHHTDTLVQQGYQPVHALYVHAQNVLSVIVEGLLAVPALDRFSKLLGEAEDEFMPSGPPMSPITTSFFTSWAFFDAALGLHRETVASIVLDLKHLLKIPADIVVLLEHFQRSHMGVYEHLGADQGYVQLRDLVTGKVFRVFNPTGYSGTPSELWFVRLLPNLCEPREDKIGFTTPYVLASGCANWQAFFQRGTWRAQKKAQTDENLLKYGMSPLYWLEYVLQAYLGANREHTAIYLDGVPDVGHTRPHFSPSGLVRLPEALSPTNPFPG